MLPCSYQQNPHTQHSCSLLLLRQPKCLEASDCLQHTPPGSRATASLGVYHYQAKSVCHYHQPCSCGSQPTSCGRRSSQQDQLHPPETSLDYACPVQSSSTAQDAAPTALSPKNTNSQPPSRPVTATKPAAAKRLPMGGGASKGAGKASGGSAGPADDDDAALQAGTLSRAEAEERLLGMFGQGEVASTAPTCHTCVAHELLQS